VPTSGIRRRQVPTSMPANAIVNASSAEAAMCKSLSDLAQSISGQSDQEPGIVGRVNLRSCLSALPRDTPEYPLDRLKRRLGTINCHVSWHGTHLS